MLCLSSSASESDSISVLDESDSQSEKIASMLDSVPVSGSATQHPSRRDIAMASGSRASRLQVEQ